MLYARSAGTTIFGTFARFALPTDGDKHRRRVGRILPNRKDAIAIATVADPPKQNSIERATLLSSNWNDAIRGGDATWADRGPFRHFADVGFQQKQQSFPL
jgi:hypothetical protein